MSIDIGQLRELHARGYSDGEIARCLWPDMPEAEQENARLRVRYHRHKLGLPNNNRSPRQRLNRYKSWRRWAYHERWKNLVSLRRQHWRLYAARHGWPHDQNLSPREVDILNVLSEHRAQTRKQICQKLGIRYTARALRSGVKGSYLGRLITLGLVKRAGTIIIGRRPHCLYMLSSDDLTAKRTKRKTSVERLIEKIRSEDH